MHEDQHRTLKINDPDLVVQVPQMGRVRKGDQIILTDEEKARLENATAEARVRVNGRPDRGILDQTPPEPIQAPKPVKNPCGECQHYRGNAVKGECHGMPPQCAGHHHAEGTRWAWPVVGTNDQGCSLWKSLESTG